jgi:hypothetical protein
LKAILTHRIFVVLEKGSLKSDNDTGLREFQIICVNQLFSFSVGMRSLYRIANWFRALPATPLIHEDMPQISHTTGQEEILEPGPLPFQS